LPSSRGVRILVSTRDTRQSGATLADPTLRQSAHRVRQKRLRQAVSTACDVQAWQSNPVNAGVPLIPLADHNSVEFLDGYADVRGCRSAMPRRRPPSA
jgi:hypothetical protein